MTDQPTWDVPSGWELASLNVVTELNPRFEAATHTDNPNVSFVPMPAMEAGTGIVDVGRTRRLEDVRKGYTHFREGDVLFAKITPCMENGKMAVVPSLENDLGFGSTEFHVLRPRGAISPQYIYYFVSSQQFRSQAQHNMTGAVGQRRVPASYLADQSVPIPPTNEQVRIVAKIEELFSELDKAIESLKTVRRQLEVYRQSVLKYAFEGKLTAQWREENTDKLETREQLLARVKKERAAYYERQIQDWMTVVKDWETKGQLGKKPSKPKKPSAPFLLRAEDLSSLPRLPEGWSWLSLSAVVGHVQTGPFGSLLHKADYVSSGTPLVNPSHIRSGRIQPDRNLAVSSDSLHRLKKYVLQENDIVIGRRGEMGRCAVVTAMETGWLCGTGSLLVRPLPSMNPGFYSWVLGSQRVKDFLAASSIGTTMHNLNEGILHRIPVPVCSRHEQDEVFNEIRRQYQRLDELEAVIDFEVANSASLRQSILTKAFAGRLVLQDLNDEPASVLLDRIKEEKAKSSDLTRRNRKAKTAA